MNNAFVRHFISFCGALVALLAWYSGYVSGGNGWWWTAFGVLVIYLAIYTIIEV